MLAQLLLELSRVEEHLHDTGVVDNVRPLPQRTCPNGCGCRWGTFDADRHECACDGPCCGGEDDTWFSQPFTELADLAIDAIITLIHHTHDVSQVGAILVDRTQHHVRQMVNAKVTASRTALRGSPEAIKAQEALRIWMTRTR